MSGVYDGIPREGLQLLMENKFRDSKEFYEENKAALQRMVVTPMRQIAGALAPQLFALDPHMLLEPSRMVSRVRRDTRFTKEKYLYRDNLWINFARRSETPQPWPYMWFGIEPEDDSWSCGICVMTAVPVFMRHFRERLQTAPEPFLAALAEAQALGALPGIESFKKDRAPDAPERLKPWLNAKGFHIMYETKGLDILKDGAILTALVAQYGAFAEMYRWLLDVSEEFLMKQV